PLRGGGLRRPPSTSWRASIRRGPRTEHVTRNTMQIWLNASGINRSKIFRRVTKMGRILGEGMTEKAVWHIVKDSAKRIGLEKLAPHDLRRTCARLCKAAGGELEQIQFLLGHVSIQTTERYLGSKQRIRSAVNDRIGIEPSR
ncbi:MAG: tyrosine-type recombinase/integrase, partial [Acidobacteriaceae bacterium]|nr:tyrosine-type recombinase/integrase [Acidobacteriaceae bacterium]